MRVPDIGPVDGMQLGLHVNGGGTHVELSSQVPVKLPPSGEKVPVNDLEQ
jgi:hypothetical protein